MGHSFPHNLRLVSMVEATSITGPLKPLLMFSRLSRHPSSIGPGLTHLMLTTRRPSRASPEDPLRSAAVAAGITFQAITERHAGDWRVIPAFARAIHEFGPDLIETHDAKSHFILALMRLIYPSIRRLPWVAFHHGYTRVSRRIRLYQQLDRISLRFATRVNTVCQPFANELAGIGVPRERIAVLTNTVLERATPSHAEIAAVCESLNRRPGELIVLNIGRLSQEKGHADLLDAAASLPDALRGRLHIVFAGEGPEGTALQQRAAARNLKVTFLGHVTDPWTLYHAADLFVLSSHSEGSPLVMFEAMAAGLPIVATEVGGVPEVLTDERSALLVRPRDPASLATRLERLMVDESFRRSLSRTALGVLQNYTPESYAHRLWDVYRSAVSP